MDDLLDTLNSAYITDNALKDMTDDVLFKNLKLIFKFLGIGFLISFSLVAIIVLIVFTI